MPPSTTTDDCSIRWEWVVFLMILYPLVIFGIAYIIDDICQPIPDVRIYDFTLSPNPTGNRSSTAASPPLAANCTVVLAFDNNNADGEFYYKVNQYDEVELSVVVGGRNETLARAHAETFWQGNAEQKPLAVTMNHFSVPADLQSTAVVYTFTVNVKSRVRENPGANDEKAFYIKATCDDVRVGFGSTQGADRIGTMLEAPRKCRVVKLKSRFII
ncbi:unnamed protein product [Cuscuta epithymum]|uniref:Late embryogenesis abundant protein LEA-2 subgroup domain-containing protein n=1 Tax=Cuscuta epithymum TaxID=186058 RepID=A0AAV0ES99_9ASTE|nr:unnamed protein product [Cuscuta epithymum]